MYMYNNYIIILLFIYVFIY